MKYFTRKTFIGKNLLGQDIEIPEYSYTDTQDNIICWNRLPVCSIDSQIGREYFVWADLGDELAREALESDIIFNKFPVLQEEEIPIYDQDGKVIEIQKISKYSKYSLEEASFLRKNFSKYLEPGEGICFNKEFFKAPLKDLSLIAAFFKK